MKRSLFLILLVILVGLSYIPLFKDINFGLDLKGGFEILYEVSSLDDQELTSDMMKATYKTISRRVDSLGVLEPEIEIEGSNRIRIKLAGVTNKEDAGKILSKAATLSFRDTKDNLLMSASVLKAGGARNETDNQGKPAVGLSVADIDKFYEVTKAVKDYPDNRIVIWLDFEEEIDSFATTYNCGDLENSNCLSAATVSQAFSSDVQITGSFSKEEVSTLVELINSGSLPTKLNELSSRIVTASFGENSLQKTLLAGIIGITIIMGVLIFIYRFSGLIASIGLLIYGVLVFFIFWMIGGVLTLPGIASLLLGIGMAVDANVLSFERIKEELKAKHSLKEAFRIGYKNSLSSIIDSNITTLIVAIVLFVLGESAVKGFATMLMISIFSTIMIMVFVVRNLIRWFLKSNYFEKKQCFFIGFKNKKTNKKPLFERFNYLKKYKFFVIGTSFILLVGLILTLTMGLNLSVDFKGGTDFTITANKISEKEIKASYQELGFKDIELSRIDEKSNYVKIGKILKDSKIVEISDHFKEKYNATVESGSVSTVVKQELIKNAILSTLLAFIGIIIYVSFRFTFNFAVAGILALIHDAFFVVAMFSIFKIEVDTIFIAAILTIVGYSINDTVVVFDRIREENLNNNKLDEVINKSLGVTMKRSLLTSVTTLIPVVALLLFGSAQIFNFNIAMFIGLIAGCYSSIFIASPIWYILTTKRKIKSFVKKEVIEEIKIKGINS